jgi:hypothetical protein
MRGAFGLISLLLGIALMAYLWSSHTAVVSHSSNEALDQVRQISGHDADGKSVLESIKTAAGNDGSGRFKSLVVTELVPGGAMEKFYGLKTGDRITVVGQYPVDLSTDAGTANAMLLDAYEKSLPLTVTRDKKEITLPLRATGNSEAPGSPAKSIEDQIKQIEKQVGQ